MRHADRCRFWKAPESAESWQNSLHDAYLATPPGMMLVYRMGVPGGDLTGKPHPAMRLAITVAAQLGGSLVQWPSEAPNGRLRTWAYAIQKPGEAREAAA